MRQWIEIGLGMLFIGGVLAILQNWAIVLGALVLFLAYQGYQNWNNSPIRREKRARKRTWDMYESALASLGGKADADSYEEKLAWAKPIYERLPRVHNDLATEIIEVAGDLYDLEGFGETIPPPPAICESREGARYRDTLNHVVARVADPSLKRLAQDTLDESFSALIGELPPIAANQGDVLGFLKLREYGDVRSAVAEAIFPFYRDPVISRGLFSKLRERLDQNLCAASGVPYSRENVDQGNLILPDSYTGDNVVSEYLADTPFENVFEVELPFAIPAELRFEHTMVVAGSGHGKTTLLGEMILADLEKAINGGGGFAVIDPKGTLIDDIAHLTCFNPDDGALRDRLIIVDPRQDVAHPPAINMFDLGDALDDLDEADRLAVRNNALELIEYLFTELLSVDMTGRQEAAFRYVGDLMMTIPNATILTLRDFLERPEEFTDDIERCDRTTRDYLSNQFMSPRFKAVREQLSDRVYAMLKLPMIEAMFSNPTTKVDVKSAVNEGKIVLIKADENFLSTTGSSLFGSVWIALFFQACLSRVSLKREDRLGFTLYIDEASMFFSEKLRQLLVKAREFKLGTVFAFQDLEMIEDPRLRSSMLGSTSTKLVGGLNSHDRRLLANEMNSNDDYLRRPRKRLDTMTTEFAIFVRGVTETPVTLTFPIGGLAQSEKMSDEDFDKLIEDNRANVSHGPPKDLDSDGGDPAPPEPDPLPPAPPGRVKRRDSGSDDDEFTYAEN